MTFIERFTVLMNHYNLSSAAFAKRIGVTGPCITHILNGRNKYPSTEILIKVGTCFPDVSRDWLLLGEGPMFLDEKNQERSPVRDDPETAAAASVAEPVSSKSADKMEEASQKASDPANEMVNEPYKTDVRNAVKIETAAPNPCRGRRVTQILAFYDDGTYEMFRQSCE